MNIEKLKLTDEEICTILNKNHKTGQIYFTPDRLKKYLPYYNEIIDLLSTQFNKFKDSSSPEGSIRPEEVKKLVEAERARILGKDRPIIVCLCGSTRFMEYFRCRARIETLAGKIVLTVSGISTYSSSTDPQKTDPETKRKLDELHLRKIDIADEVFVLNVGGYIGESTSKEIAYAKEHNKPIRYFEEAV